MKQISKGKKSEALFEKTASDYNFKAIKSTISQDKLHVDYKIYNSKGFSKTVDVKSMSKIPNHLIVELVNNWSYKGWLYSQTNLIALYTTSSFNIYSLPKLQDYIKNKNININDWHCSRTDWKPYIVYSRREMAYNDKWILVPLVDIEQCLVTKWSIKND